MQKHSGLTLKIFSFIFVVALISLVLFENKNLFSITKNNKEMVANLENAEILRDSKIKPLHDYFTGVKNGLILLADDKFIKNSSAEINKAYRSLHKNFSPDIIAALREELKKIYTSLYGQEHGLGLVPDNKTDVVAQATAIRGDIGDRELFNSLAQDNNVKAYIVIEKNINDYIHNKFADSNFEDVIITDNRGRIIYAYGKKSGLGHNIYSGNAGGYHLPNAKNILTNKPAGKGYFYELHNKLYPNQAVSAFLTEKIPGGFTILAVAGGESLKKITVADNAVKTVPAYAIYIANSGGKIAASKYVSVEPKEFVSGFDLTNNTKENNGRYKKITSSNGNYIVVYAPLNIPNLDWALAAAVPYEEASFLVATLIPSLVIILIIALISYLFARIFMKPIKNIRDDFMKVASGEIVANVKTSSKDEMLDLVDCFNIVAHRRHGGLGAALHGPMPLANPNNEVNDVREYFDDDYDFVSSILNANSIILIVADENNKIVYLNKSFLKIYGNKYAIGKDVVTIIPPAYQEAIATGLQKTRDSGEVHLISTISEIGDNDIHIDWVFSTVGNKSSNNKYVAGIGINVTDKYKVSEHLQENEAMLQLIMSHAQDAIIVSDDKDMVVIVNEAAEKMLGYSFKELEGKAVIPTVIPEEYEDEFIDDIKSGMTLEIYAVNNKGDRFPVELSISKINIGGKSKTLYVIRDASIRKKREMELYKVLEKAKMAEKAKSEFLANMSHEIRTPLNGIVGFLSLLKQTPLNKTQLEYLNIINSSSDSLLSIINDILDFSKVESGKMSLEAIEFNATDAFEQVTELYAAKASEKGINLFVTADANTPEWLVGDQLRVKQILSNLLSNAIKFTNSGGSINVGISVVNINGKNCNLRMSVKDTGIGISKEKQALIFDAFSQADSSVTRKYGGSGLGLSICVSIAKLMGGSGLQINSEEGEGSEFFFTAPFGIGLNKAKEKPVFKDVMVALYKCSTETCQFRKACQDYLEVLQCQVKIFTNIDELKSFDKVDVICMGYRLSDKRFLEEIQMFSPDKPVIYFACDNNVGNLRNLESKTVRTISQPLNISKFLDAFTFLIRKNTTITQVAVDEAETVKIFSGHALVVEDNAVNRRLADIMLRQFGLTVELAINGKEALNLFLRNKYDLIFMDIHMPVLDGVSATKEILRIEKEAGSTHTPIVALTANVIQEDRDSYLAAGMDGFLAKPIEKNKLETVLIDFLESDEAKKLLDTLAKVFEMEDRYAIKTILKEFHKVAWKQIYSMREALVEKDMKKLASIANSLKGAAMNLHFNNIVSAANRIEVNISGNRDTDYESIINDLEMELKTINNMIE